MGHLMVRQGVGVGIPKPFPHLYGSSKGFPGIASQATNQGKFNCKNIPRKQEIEPFPQIECFPRSQYPTIPPTALGLLHMLRSRVPSSQPDESFVLNGLQRIRYYFAQ